MDDAYIVLDARSPALRDPMQEFAYDVLIGLSERPKRIPSRYFYDDRGSTLFQQIMNLPEYYPTDCEQEILQRHGPRIIEPICDRSLNIVDLGAGDGSKTLILLEQLVRRGADVRYVPIDISEAAIAGVVEAVRLSLPQIEVQGLVSEYTDGLRWLAATHAHRNNLVLLLGSNIGNFDRARARAFLRRIWAALRAGDYLLVGFDLKKDIELLLSAYNDRQGITAAFNVNLLTRMNRELGANFDIAGFRHYGTYNVFSGAMESYLVSLHQQVVHVDALCQSFRFEAWEPIHTEYSYKYLHADIDDLAARTGFLIDAQFHDERHYFIDCLLRVEKPFRGLGS